MATTATRFDAASDRASYAGASGNPPAPSAGWSAAWWVYISTDRNDFSTMLRLHTGSGGSTVLNLAMGATGQAPGAYTVGGSVETSSQLTIATWYYLAYSVTGTTLTIYVFNAAGALVTSTSGTIGGGTPDGLTVGGRSSGDSSEWFDGRLSRMRIWSAVLSQAQFAAEQFAAEPVVTANLWAHYKLTGAGDLADAAGGHNLAAGTTATTTEAGPPLSEGVSGSATAALGALFATATGQRVVPGQATAPLGGPTATVTGIRRVNGSATAPLGGVSAAATGARQVNSVVTASLGGVTAHAIASRLVHGQAVAGLGALSATSTGKRAVSGSAAAALFGVAATSTGRRTVHGVATASLGRLIAAVVVSDDHNVSVRGRLAPQGRLRTRLGTRRNRATLGAQR